MPKDGERQLAQKLLANVRRENRVQCRSFQQAILLTEATARTPDKPLLRTTIM